VEKSSLLHSIGILGGVHLMFAGLACIWCFKGREVQNEISQKDGLKFGTQAKDKSSV
jgi:hypothetical protein